MKKLKWFISILLLSILLGGCGTSYKIVKPGVVLSQVPTWSIGSAGPRFYYNDIGSNPMLFISNKDTVFAKKITKAVKDTTKAQGTIGEIVCVDASSQTEDPTEALKNANALNIGQSVSVVAVDPKLYGITETPALLYIGPMKQNPQVITGEKEILAAIVDRYTMRVLP